MAHHKSAKKRIRQIKHRTVVNGTRASRIRTYVRKVEQAIASGDGTAARDALRAAQPEMMRGITRGIVHRKTVARKLSRLSNRIKAMAG